MDYRIQDFFELCKSYQRDDIEAVYIAIQSALAFGAKSVDVGLLLAKIRPPSYRGIDDGSDPGIGVEGLAFFYRLYKIELIDAGMTDYHTYEFLRKHDNNRIDVTLQTTCEPQSDTAREKYETQLERLRNSREDLLVNNRFGTIDEFLFGS